MQSIIEEIFYGNRGQMDNIDFGKEYKRLGAESMKICGKFFPSLTDEQKKMFDDLCLVSAGQEAESVRIHYVEGFKVGFLIAVECFIK